MKRAVVIAVTALCLATPAHAVGPLAAILIDYVKQRVKEQVIAYAKSQLRDAMGDSLSGVPGLGMLAAVAPGAFGGMAPRPSMSPEAMAALKSTGMFDTNAQPLTDAEWKEYENTVVTMAAAAGADEAPDIGHMRAMLTQMPQMSGMVRQQLNQFREIKAEQAHMREVYAQMSEAERQETVDELVKNFKETPVEYQPQAKIAMQSDALGLPDDLKRRLAVALQ
ncbi:hypothetical protein E4K72_10565 [Oxalobacteraceae bacterium OM1]|nr:hypothetical protein E4K72_10565 [Oxalobacteraceae bacterium OM1]